MIRTKGPAIRRAFLSAAFLPLLMAAVPAASQCPPADRISVSMETIFRKKVQVKKVRPSPLDGICEIFVSVQGRTSIIYSDGSGRFFITGNIIDAEDRLDLTREAMAEFNRFTPEEMKKVESLTALTLGTSGPAVYFVTDPM